MQSASSRTEKEEKKKKKRRRDMTTERGKRGEDQIFSKKRRRRRRRRSLYKMLGWRQHKGRRQGPAVGLGMREGWQGGDLFVLWRREKLRNGNLKAYGELFQSVIGRRHLPVFDLAECRARETSLICGLLQRPVARLAQVTDPLAQIKRNRTAAGAVFTRDPDQSFGII